MLFSLQNDEREERTSLLCWNKRVPWLFEEGDEKKEKDLKREKEKREKEEKEEKELYHLFLHIIHHSFPIQIALLKCWTDTLK